MSKPQDTRKCLTPGATYGLGADERGNLMIKITIPRGSFRVLQYVRGEFGVTIKTTKTDANKRARYDQMYAHRERVLAAFHEALEPVVGDLYRTIWPLVFAGSVIDGEVMPDTYDEYLGSGKL
jgi:hypothetical protein